MCTLDASQLADKYRLSHSISDGTYEQLRIAAKHFSDWCNAAGCAIWFDDDTVNGYLLYLEKAGYSQHTIRSRRGNLLTLWRFAIARKIASEPPGTIRGAKPKYGNPDAWTEAETWAIAKTALTLKGTLWGLPRGEFLHAFVLTKWDTAYRLGDMLGLRWFDLSDGVLWIAQHKTGDYAPRPLWPETLEAIEAIRPPTRELVFPCNDRRRFFSEFTQLVEAAHKAHGVRKGTSKWIRRASGTAAEKCNPGGGMRQLGHRSPGTTWRSYMDRRQLVSPAPLVPSLNPDRRQ